MLRGNYDTLPKCCLLVCLLWLTVFRLAHAEPIYQRQNLAGQSLDGPVSNWACVRDLHSGLVWEVKSRNPGAKVLYLTAERFMYSFADALQTREGPAFKEKLRTIDLLLIDEAADVILPENPRIHSQGWFLLKLSSKFHRVKGTPSS